MKKKEENWQNKKARATERLKRGESYFYGDKKESWKFGGERGMK